MSADLNRVGLDERTKSTIRRRIKRFNDAWKAESDDEKGVVLQDQGDGTWRLQTLVFVDLDS
jgi:hypothetical protein